MKEALLESEAILQSNKNNYETLYSKEEAFLRYPADWILRFHNMFLKKNISPGARILDYGCGSGNNSIFFARQGYDVHGLEVSPSAINLIKQNLKAHSLNENLINNYKIVKPDTTSLPYEDCSFDFILSNQVLYYLPNKQHIQKLCEEFSRILKPNGFVFFTMMGPKNYYITYHTKNIVSPNIYEVKIEQAGHRLNGVKELVYLVRDENELTDLFSAFETVTTGYYDQRMFDLKSCFHWIYVGKKRK